MENNENNVVELKNGFEDLIDPPTKTNGVTGWCSNHKVATAGIAGALIAGGTYLVKTIVKKRRSRNQVFDPQVCDEIEPEEVDNPTED